MIARRRKLAPRSVPFGSTIRRLRKILKGETHFQHKLKTVISMGKLIQPEDIADTILFLASEQAGMLTGQVIKVSGGHAL